MHKPLDYNETPFIAIWETTQACDLACVHCRAEAQPDPLPGELSVKEGRNLVRQVAEMGTPVLVFSGGDPMKRSDLLDLIRLGKDLGLRVGTIPAATESLTREKVFALKEAGLDQMALSLDAPTAEAHDGFRQVPGTFAITLQAAQWARECGLPLQINSVLSRCNGMYLDSLMEMVEGLGIVFWEVFFLVQVGRGTEQEDLTADEVEAVFAGLYELAARAPFIVKITEAPHFHRYTTARKLKEAGLDPAQVVREGVDLPAELRRALGPGGSMGRAPSAVNAGKGHLFISSEGEVFPSGFLPLSAGHIRETGLAEIYRNSPLFKQLRDPDLLKGRCGVCEYRSLCGGSRARAYALKGDPLAEDPSCNYLPAAGI
ncbi:MAG: TIGR04053 family radical SAM/SPASM domain-containing protein [Candidatus Omnitrophica bacterium]|nr:TIGR04053 family radical SAM/SPASM domain-containing protein [Candidatus Omnitrophota bacterium]